MPVRHANAVWQGNLKEGRGEMQFADYSGPFTFGSRFEEASGTNPEELIGGAIPGCFSMALAADLEGAGYDPKHVETEATVDEIRDLMRCQGDSHVMRQTLARTNEYTGERDWSIE